VLRYVVKVGTVLMMVVVGMVAAVMHVGIPVVAPKVENFVAVVEAEGKVKK
jgi:hypothetical protein